MPIQPIKYKNYKEIQDLEDVTPIVTQTSRSLTSTQNFWCKQHVIFWTALFVLIIILVLCVYFGVDDEMATALVYQTSLGSIGGINVVADRCASSVSLYGKEVCDTMSVLSAILTVVPARKFQIIIGFGGAFTESAGFVFSKLSIETQQKVVDLYFGENGIGLNMGRIHINSCDFSLSSYNYDDQPGDFDLDHFDSGLIRDSMYVIPLLRRAIAASSRPLLLVASPWSPPAWMKVQSGGRTDEDDTLRYFEVMTGSAQPNGLKDDPRVKTAWASYITKFLEAYRDKGVSVWAVTPQNEPEFAAPWEACVYNASHEGDFIANYLGPILKGRLPKTKILGFDHNKDHLLQWAETLMGDPAVERYLDGMAFHWYGGNDRVTDGTYGFEAVNATHHLLRPDQILLATEGCTCPGVRIDDWLRAERLAHDVMYDLMNFGQGWIDWNLLLDSTGGPNHAGNVCDSPIVALPDYSDVHVQPKYYYFGHISKFVTPGSVRVQSSIVGDFQLRAMDPNIQAGVEMGVFSCERSVRQTWQMRAENGSDVFTLALATSALAVDSFVDAPFPPDHQPVHSDLCVARGDTNRAYLRLVNCKSLENIVRFQWNEVNQLVEDGTGLCVGLAGDVLESGALLSLDSCASPSPQKQSFLADKQTGEIRLAGFDSSGLNSMCWTAGWPFLSSVAFVNPEGQTVLVVMNEGSTKIEISIVSDSFFRSKKTLIGERSIQTIVLQNS